MEAVPHVRKIVLAGGIAVLAVLGTSATAYAKGCSCLLYTSDAADE